MPDKKKTKSKKKPDQNLTQKERFIEYAKEIGVDDSDGEFERVFDKIVENSHK
ncbi:MAG: hypothetical protein KDI46_04425 [Alphaproteobacteria bacterium]|nr:hypothetical protein [Alphaproteobacteria bacterium]